MSKSERPAYRTHQILDPRTLGRPVHLLGRFTDQLRLDLGEELQARFNRRNRAAFRIREVVPDAEPPATRWLAYDTRAGRMDFAITRKLLLCFLDYRLGVAPEGTHSPASDGPLNDAEHPAGSDRRETATEERMATALGRHFAGRVAERIEALHGAGDAGASGERPVQLVSSGSVPAADGAWTLRIGIFEEARGIDGMLWIRLDERAFDHLLDGLAPARASTPLQKFLGVSAGEPFASRLRIQLGVRLVEQEVTVGNVIDLRPGDVLPIRMGPADVLVGDSRLFTARVAEHKGRLCLTSFEDAE